MGLSVVSTTFTPATTGYTTAQDIGGAFSIPSGVGNNIQIRIRKVSVAFTTASSSAAGAINAIFFNSAPTTALSDAVAPTWNSADPAKIAAMFATNALFTVATMTIWENNTSNPTLSALPKSMTTDTTGNINLAILAGAAITYTTPTTATLKVEFEY